MNQISPQNWHGPEEPLLSNSNKALQWELAQCDFSSVLSTSQWTSSSKSLRPGPTLARDFLPVWTCDGHLRLSWYSLKFSGPHSPLVWGCVFNHRLIIFSTVESKFCLVCHFLQTMQFLEFYFLAAAFFSTHRELNEDKYRSEVITKQILYQFQVRCHLVARSCTPIYQRYWSGWRWNWANRRAP